MTGYPTEAVCNINYSLNYCISSHRHQEAHHNQPLAPVPCPHLLPSPQQGIFGGNLGYMMKINNRDNF